MGTATRFWNWNAERYSRQPIADEASYQKKLAITQKYLSSETRALEFGCGTGSTAVVHAPRVASYDAIDVSEKMVEIGRRKAAEAGLGNLRFTVGTLEEAGRPDASCDAILGLNILHLVPDLDGTLRTVAGLLVPGGHFISSTICLEDLRGGLRLLGLATRALPFLPTVRSFSSAELKGMLAGAGFAIEEEFEQRPGVVFLVAVKQRDRVD